MSDELSNFPFCGGKASIIEVTERKEGFTEEVVSRAKALAESENK